MDHTEIAEERLVERYYRRELPEALEARFEAHFLGCPECQERLAVEQGLRGGARELALLTQTAQTAQVADAVRAVTVTGLLAWWVRRRYLVAFALVALVAGSAAWVWVTRQGMATAQRERLAWQERSAAAELEAQRLTAELEAARDAARQATGPGTPLPPPEPTASGSGEPLSPELFLLRTVRGESEVPTLPGAAAVTLAVYVDRDPRFVGYRVSVEASSGIRWQRGGLQPNALEALLVTLPAGFLEPGEYRFRLEGEGAGGGTEALELYPFRVAP
jgi:hypothetical protein